MELLGFLHRNNPGVVGFLVGTGAPTFRCQNNGRAPHLVACFVDALLVDSLIRSAVCMKYHSSFPRRRSKGTMITML
jgi:hypothetical protein